MSRYDELKLAIDQSKNEHDIGTYLKKHLDLIRVFNEHSWNCVIQRAEFQIGPKYRSDFIILSACSGYWNCVLIEMQSPCDKIFTKKGETSKGLKEAQRQVQEWSMYIEENQAAFRCQLADLAKKEPAYCSRVDEHTSASSELRDSKTVIYYKYKVLIGRRAFLDNETNKRRNTFGSFKIVTFDRLLDYARRLDEADAGIV